MTPTRLARDVSTVAVAGIAAWSSWSHMVSVALRFGERPEVAYVLPLSVDGMLVVASAAMVEDKRAGRRVRWSARAAFAVGVAASVAANIAAAEPSLGARIVAAWPAVALLLVVEMLTRAQPAPHHERVRSDDPDQIQRGLPASTVRTGLGKSRRSASAGVEPPGVGKPSLVADDLAAKRTSKPLSRHNKRPTTASGRTVGRRRGAAEVIARLRAEHPQASLAEVASAAGVSQRHARRLMRGVSRDAEPMTNKSTRTSENPREHSDERTTSAPETKGRGI
ncbi:DUF2637 domain-containing protein [Micromonospora tulbaghiae]|uniref:DUF2637 domain-containing protein n=1 Tax=Micromonospora tulbaghiae TaxID=479978 RepID=UPI003EBAD954